MIKWALVFALISLTTGVFGFAGVAEGAAGWAKVLSSVALLAFVILLVLGELGLDPVKS